MILGTIHTNGLSITDHAPERSIHNLLIPCQSPASSPILTALDEKPRRPFVRPARPRGGGGLVARVPACAARERAVAARGLRLAARVDGAGAQRRRPTRHEIFRDRP